jgi:hypothetical protein
VLEEQWVPLPGYPNYEVSNYGRVTNVRTGRDLKPYPDKRTGILRVAIYNNGSRKDVQLKRLVAECYFLNYNGVIEVSHKNGNKSDCSVLNLTLGFDVEKYAKPLAEVPRGSAITLKGFTPDQIVKILNRVESIRASRETESSRTAKSTS